MTADNTGYDKCAWCGGRLPQTWVSQRRYCCRRCAQAMRDYRYRGVGTPGKKPRRLRRCST